MKTALRISLELVKNFKALSLIVLIYFIFIKKLLYVENELGDFHFISFHFILYAR